MKSKKRQVCYYTKITSLQDTFLHHLQSALSRTKNKTVQITGCHPVPGGDINTTYLLTSGEENYFVKTNTDAWSNMLLKEKEGLVLLRAAKTSLAIPEPLLHGTCEGQSYLLMEYLEKGAESKAGWQQLAAGLAQLHQTSSAYFGLEDNNYIGTIVQHNTPAATWSGFYAQQRIMPLMQQAYNRQLCIKAAIQMAEALCNKLSSLMPVEPPALLHGDLWSGNRMFTATGKAALYDPAVYYGHREMDIAMTKLFGGFDAHFYNAYNEVYPLQAGWRNRTALCQLYPLLVHLLLFGKHYYTGVKDILKQYS